jgi:Raf kinase inhibitor-like YbhB/YbcL family protein
MLEKMPSFVGHSLRNVRPGLEKLVYAREATEAPQTIRVESVAFDDQHPIPSLFTADGESDSPPLRWRGVPHGAKSIVLIVEDADSPTPEPLVHALAWKAPGCDDDLIPGALTGKSAADEGLRLGRNSLLGAGWLPPHPPPGHGPHRYVFEIFAVDADPPHSEDLPGRTEIVEAIRGHVLAKGCLIGVYERAAK